MFSLTQSRVYLYKTIKYENNGASFGSVVRILNVSCRRFLRLWLTPSCVEYLMMSDNGGRVKVGINKSSLWSRLSRTTWDAYTCQLPTVVWSEGTGFCRPRFGRTRFGTSFFGYNRILEGLTGLRQYMFLGHTNSFWNRVLSFAQSPFGCSASCCAFLVWNGRPYFIQKIMLASLSEPVKKWFLLLSHLWFLFYPTTTMSHKTFSPYLSPPCSLSSTALSTSGWISEPSDLFPLLLSRYWPT